MFFGWSLKKHQTSCNMLKTLLYMKQMTTQNEDITIKESENIVCSII